MHILLLCGERSWQLRLSNFFRSWARTRAAPQGRIVLGRCVLVCCGLLSDQMYVISLALCGVTDGLKFEARAARRARAERCAPAAQPRRRRHHARAARRVCV
jgi:hypothetical protein